MSRKPPMDSFIKPSDFRDAARRRIPGIFFDYLDGAAGDERTAASNVDDFRRFHFLPKVLRPTSDRSLEATFLGQRHGLPIMLGPIGSLGQFRAHAERSAFNVANASEIPACLSSFATTPPEQLAKDAQGRAAFQLYVLKDFNRTEEVIERVMNAGFDSLFVTVDTCVSGIRERDIKNGLRLNTRLSAANILGMLRRPTWLMDMMQTHPVRMALADGWPVAGKTYLSQAAFLASQIDADLTWEKLSRIRSLWPRKLIVKGIMRGDDMLKARDFGANGVVISNHGGRQLDGCPSTISVLSSLPSMPADFDIILDGGVRRGADVLKAICLGASACSLGRAYAYALAAGGKHGLARLLQCFRNEMSVSMALLGMRSIDELRESGRELLAFDR